MIRKILGARAAHGLWAFSLILLLSPSHPRSPVGVLPPAPDLPTVVVQVIAPAMPAANALASVRPPLAPTPWVLLLAWGTGMASLLGLAIMRTVRAGLLVRRSKDITAEPSVHKALEALGGLPRRAIVCESSDLLSPAVCGLWRPVVLLPPGWAAGADATELRCVLLHEIGHIRRGDLLWRWAFQIARAVHWFNPLVWLAERSARVDQEMACDEWVLAQDRGVDCKTYGEAILRTAQRSGGPRVSSPVQAGMAESRLGLSRRIHHLVGTRPRSLWSSLAALGIGLMVFLVVAPRNGILAAPAQAPATQVEIESKFLETTPEIAEELFRTRVAGNQQPILGPKEYQDLLGRLNTIKGVDFVSAPKVTTRSGNRATIEIVREFRYPTEFSVAQDSGVPTPLAFDTKNTGVTLKIEPLITPDGRILCEMEPEVVEFLGFINYGASQPGRTSSKGDALTEALIPGAETGQTLNQPVFQTRKAQTAVSLRSGETVLFGGLTRRDKQAGTDLIGNKQDRSEKEIERVLYIFVTARLVDKDGMLHESPKRTKSPSALHDPAASSVSILSQPPDPTTNGETPYGTPVPNKPGFITSPHAPEMGYVDVRGFSRGTKAKCPYTGKLFLVP